ncbi:MAG: Peroxiredoxin [Planctomycetaceae bacterium]|nr:Peroxiredoxin [Planctomycetaceae bacterium]
MFRYWYLGFVLASVMVVVWLGVGRRQARADQASETRAAVERALKQAVVKPGKGRVGRKVANFVLPDVTGKSVGLSDFADKKLVVIFSMGTGCPISNLYLPDLIAAQEKFGGEFLQVIGINSQSGDTREEVAAHAKKFGVNFPVLHDPDQRIADLLGIQRTAETFLLDQQRVVQYHGRIDDRNSYTTKRDKPEREDLREAAKELLDGKPVSVSTTNVEGCLISRPKPREAGTVTFTKHVASILQKNCQECHHPGTAAPFSLLSYDDAVSWSAMIKEVVLERRMPPWHADPRHGHFSNDRSMSQADINILVDWVNQGTPAGEEKDAPPAKEFVDGWRIGKPDVVFELPEEVSIPANGTVPYKYFSTETHFKEDMWVEAAEARPGNRGVIHHIIVFFQEPTAKRGVQERNWIVAAAPGDEPLRLPPGVGRKIPAGSKLIWQMHYTPTGKPEKDRSQVGLKFCKTPPEKVARVYGISNKRFIIPPGNANHEVKSTHTLDKPVTLLGMMPHMHLRGKAFDYVATYMDGHTEVLLSVPQFDFNWQTSYRFEKPLAIPAGTRIDCVAHFDNSAGNPANPDPKSQVRWGDQTWNEMMIGYLDYIEE